MEWISVKDRLPEQFQEVLCYSEDKEYYVAVYSKNTCIREPGYYYLWNSGHCCGRGKSDATYWMPLPEEPKGDG